MHCFYIWEVASVPRGAGSEITGITNSEEGESYRENEICVFSACLSVSLVTVIIG